MSQTFYIRSEGKLLGPVDLSHLIQLRQDGIGPDALVSDSEGHWQTIDEILARLTGTEIPVLAPGKPAPPTSSQPLAGGTPHQPPVQPQPVQPQPVQPQQPVPPQFPQPVSPTWQQPASPVLTPAAPKSIGLNLYAGLASLLLLIIVVLAAGAYLLQPQPAATPANLEQVAATDTPPGPDAGTNKTAALEPKRTPQETPKRTPKPKSTPKPQGNPERANNGKDNSGEFKQKKNNTFDGTFKQNAFAEGSGKKKTTKKVLPRKDRNTGDSARSAPAPKDVSPPGRDPDLDATPARSGLFPFTFTLPDLDGELVSLKSQKGKVVIVDFWGTWCPPCRAEVPHFVRLQKRYGRDGLQIIGINYEKNTSNPIPGIKTFARDFGINYPCVIGNVATRTQVPGFRGYPTTLFVDRRGNVRKKVVGQASYSSLEAIVKPLLAEPAARRGKKSRKPGTDDDGTGKTGRDETGSQLTELLTPQHRIVLGQFMGDIGKSRRTTTERVRTAIFYDKDRRNLLMRGYFSSSFWERILRRPAGASAHLIAAIEKHESALLKNTTLLSWTNSFRGQSNDADHVKKWNEDIDTLYKNIRSLLAKDAALRAATKNKNRKTREKSDC